MTIVSTPQAGKRTSTPRRTKRRSATFFAHSRLDSLLLLITAAQFGVLEYGAWSCGTISWSATLAIGVATLFLSLTNFECVAHNFIHTPFFRSKNWNLAFGVFNSLLLGQPQTLYRLHHLHHHKYNNDLPDPRTGTTNDFSSTWRHGEPPTREESIVTYALLSYFRTDFKLLAREVRRRQLTKNVVCEISVMLAAALVLAIGNWRGLVFFCLPVYVAGTVAAMAQNYLEHYGAAPGNRQTDSVSCYSRIYNFIWFNHGYHQEHHLRPQVHWTRIAEIRELLPPESQRRVAWGAHWFNFAPVRRAAGK